MTVDLVADLAVINPFDFFLEASAEQLSVRLRRRSWRWNSRRISRRTAGRRVRRLPGDDRSQRSKPTTRFVFDLNAALQREIGYVIRMEPGIQTPDETLAKRSGSCRDSAWLLVQLLRHLGLAARFASGYLIQLKPDVKSLDGPSGATQDFTDLHAWCEVYLPGAGWVGLDPTSGLFAGEGHIPLACAANPLPASPISGTVDPCEVTFDFDMSRHARARTAARHQALHATSNGRAIEELGDRVDDVLSERDVRLTMGGEPTFVSDRRHGRAPNGRPPRSVRPSATSATR